MTKNANNILEDVNFAGKRMRWAIFNDGTFDYQQGDLLWYDAAVQKIKALDSDAHAAFLVGVAEKPSFIAPYTATKLPGGPAPQKIYDTDGVAIFGCLAGFFGTAGDTYHDGDPVYLGADAQTITNTAGGSTHPVGYIKLPSASISSPQAYVAGARVPVWVVAQYPIACL